ncbi:hypothetical protein MOE82_05245 [Bacillus licheniformis]|nr:MULTISPECIES: hypothetical protein [Bacillus]MCD2369360.1 hypothetical protein [Bacillus sp. BS3(2021)]MCJ2145190.1 hypothetical protein [Bacillus sp. B19-2]MCY7858737.1 hypothetical protein [Bacillus sonorensis]MCD2487580.1 hypothetical protein [Bacillus licheniformis]MCD2526379.1 hypothetical protein [Bacillus licheniformis]
MIAFGMLIAVLSKKEK